jgi:spore coat polysaccharide biosynthesis protein SpsF
MTDKPDTPQTLLWRGAFGDDYISRNPTSIGNVQAAAMLWAQILRRLQGDPPRTILEIGANIGINLCALRALTDAQLFAVEPNASARRHLVDESILPPGNILDGIASQIALADRSADLVFTRGVLIHIHPDDLLASCREMHRVARRYIVSIEYFSANPEELTYRNQSSALFKRDFGAFWLEHFPDLRVLDYGFAWQRLTGLDNLTWWAFEKLG